MMNNIFGSSIWQPLDLACTDEHPTWWNVAASLSSDIIQLRMIQGKDDHDHEDIENNNDRHKKLCFNNIPLRNLSVKLQYHQPAADHKWYKTLPPGEMLPRNETLGGYIFVCNNETMQEDLRRQLFGLPQKYKDSVRAITPGLPLFLYNYTAHQLHGVFQAVSFGGSNIDPTAWEDKKCRGESRFPAQIGLRPHEKAYEAS
ncbi:B2 protein-like [Mangifera indica]|uniref:B2 protein-like n=1 Tax=Mangifera indica TaxID=29780 RepID=UPI001CF9924A|nr:B2 protein-like [Mangifera indica]